MPRRPRLPKNVSRYVDRHGKERYRFRKSGCPGGHLPGYPGSAEFEAALAIPTGAGETVDLREQIAREIALGRSGNRPDRETADAILALVRASSLDAQQDSKR